MLILVKRSPEPETSTSQTVITLQVSLPIQKFRTWNYDLINKIIVDDSFLSVNPGYVIICDYKITKVASSKPHRGFGKPYFVQSYIRILSLQNNRNCLHRQ